MGQCNYYLKARFREPKAALVAMHPLTELLAEGDRAYHYWQGSRPLLGERPTAEAFWAGFREQFPRVCRYLGGLVGIADWDNGLAGLLGCLVDSTRPGATLTRSGDLLLLTLEDIWHFTQMTLLERYLKDELGAVAADSLSA